MTAKIDLYDDSPGLWRRLLARLFGAAAAVRLWLYRSGLFKSQEMDARVVSVGNLVVGGTGKTPAVIMIARVLKEKGFRPAVLTRGYRGEKPEAVNVVSDGENVLLGPSQAGDEAVLMARALPGIPVLAGRDRRRLGRAAVSRFEADVLVLDDGFQHLAVRRDVNLLLLDEASPFGNNLLLPAGPLREPPTQAARATAFVLTRAAGPDSPQAEELRRNFPGRPVFTARHKPVRLAELDGPETKDPAWLKGKKVLAFCGLARPELFLKTLAELGAEVGLMIRWPDHYNPQEKDLDLIRTKARDLGLTEVVTTAKDAVKTTGRGLDRDLKVMVLEIELEILNDPEGFLEHVLSGGEA